MNKNKLKKGQLREALDELATNSGDNNLLFKEFPKRLNMFNRFKYAHSRRQRNIY